MRLVRLYWWALSAPAAGVKKTRWEGAFEVNQYLSSSLQDPFAMQTRASKRHRADSFFGKNCVGRGASATLCCKSRLELLFRKGEMLIAGRSHHWCCCFHLQMCCHGLLVCDTLQSASGGRSTAKIWELLMACNILGFVLCCSFVVNAHGINKPPKTLCLFLL